MLEAVVEHQDLGLQLLDRDPRRPDAIGVLEMGDIGQVLLQDAAFVVESRALACSPGSGSPPACPRWRIPAGHPLDHGGLAGAPDGQVADRDHRDTRLDGLASQPRSKP